MVLPGHDPTVFQIIVSLSLNFFDAFKLKSVTRQENKTNLEYTLVRPGPARGQAK